MHFEIIVDAIVAAVTINRRKFCVKPKIIRYLLRIFHCRVRYLWLRFHFNWHRIGIMGRWTVEYKECVIIFRIDRRFYVVDDVLRENTLLRTLNIFNVNVELVETAQLHPTFPAHTTIDRFSLFRRK